MAEFHYSAIAQDNNLVIGSIQSDNEDAARQLLTSFGLREIQLREGSAGAKDSAPATAIAQSAPAQSPPPPLPTFQASASPLRSPDDARQLTEHLALLMQSGLPLAPALRATAKELPGHRLSAAINRLAGELEAGRSLEDALSADARLLPAPLRQIVLTGASSGRLADVLVRFVDIERSWIDIGRSIRMALAYPALLFALWLLFAIFVTELLLPQFTKIFLDFRTALPLPTKVIMWFSGGTLLSICAIAAVVSVLLVLLTRILLSPAARQRLIVRIPLLGPAIAWRSISIWSRWMELLLDMGLPLHRALELAGDGAANASLAADSTRLAREVSTGKKLSDSIRLTRSLPASLEPFVRWGEQTSDLPDAFHGAGDMFENRARMRTTLLVSSLPPITFVLMALGAIFLFNSILAPFLSLIRALASSWP